MCTHLRDEYGQRVQVFSVHQEIGDQQVEGLRLRRVDVRGVERGTIIQRGDQLCSEVRSHLFQMSFLLAPVDNFFFFLIEKLYVQRARNAVYHS